MTDILAQAVLRADRCKAIARLYEEITGVSELFCSQLLDLDLIVSTSREMDDEDSFCNVLGFDPRRVSSELFQFPVKKFDEKRVEKGQMRDTRPAVLSTEEIMKVINYKTY